MAEFSVENVSEFPTTGIVPGRVYLKKGASEDKFEIRIGNMAGTALVPLNTGALSFADLTPEDPSYDEKVNWFPMVTGVIDDPYEGTYKDEKLELVSPYTFRNNYIDDLYLFPASGSFGSINYTFRNFYVTKLFGLFSVVSITLATLGPITVGTASGALQLRSAGNKLLVSECIPSLVTDSVYSSYNVKPQSAYIFASNRIELYKSAESDFRTRTTFNVSDLKTDAAASGSAAIANYMRIQFISPF